MSKLAITRYYVPSAAERRAAQAKIERTRQMLARCVALQVELARYEKIDDEDLVATLERYDRAIREQLWEAFVVDYNRLYETLPDRLQRLESEVSLAKTRRTRLGLSAATLAAQTSAQDEKEQLAQIAARASGLNRDGLEKAEKAVEEAVTRRLMAAGTQSKQTGSTPTQIALAQSLLNAAMYEQGLDERTAGSRTDRVDSADPEHKRIAHLTEQLASLDESLDEFVARAAALLSESDLRKRSLQLDSLELEVSERVVAGRQTRECESLIGAALAVLAPFDNDDANEFRRRLSSAQGLTDTHEAKALASEARTWAEKAAALNDGARVRDAIVKGLQDLGYEVRTQDGAWGDGQRIAAQRPEEPNYDVELGAAANGRIQSRVRAYQHGGRSEGLNLRDVEMEQSWCDDLGRLHQKLAAEGFRAEIEREDAPGSAVQKPMAQGGPERDATRGALRQRSAD